MTHRIEPWPNPMAASSSTLDCELAQQLEAMAVRSAYTARGCLVPIRGAALPTVVISSLAYYVLMNVLVVPQGIGGYGRASATQAPVEVKL
jgi:hypothetical protein